jgi:hypothetical protein
MATAVAKRLVPLLDRVLVEKVVPPTKSAGGILLPDSMTKVGLFSFFLLCVCLSVCLSLPSFLVSRFLADWEAQSRVLGCVLFKVLGFFRSSQEG